MNDDNSINNTYRSPPVLVVGGTTSGVGKTTIACGLMAAFAQQGLIVQPFKVGPDFLDGKHHEEASASCTDNGTVTDNGTGTGTETEKSSKLQPRKSINLVVG